MLVHVLAKSGEAAKSGPIGLAVILLLCIVCYFLFKSMSKHLRKVREDFPGGHSSVETPAPDAPTAAAPAATPAGEPPSGQRSSDTAPE